MTWPINITTSLKSAPREALIGHPLGRTLFFHAAGVFQRAFLPEQERAGNVIAPSASQAGATQRFISPKCHALKSAYSDATGRLPLMVRTRAKDAAEVMRGSCLKRSPIDTGEYQRNRAVRA